jgi:hypothetical protein
MRIRSFFMPRDSYNAINALAFIYLRVRKGRVIEKNSTFALVASLSNERRASTSVETRPGIIASISFPNSTSYKR